MRYIDIVRAVVRNAKEKDIPALTWDEQKIRISAIRQKIDDIEIVVRCKDCKHRYYVDNRIPYERDWVCDWWRKDGCDEKGFCSYGERKGGEDE